MTSSSNKPTEIYEAARTLLPAARAFAKRSGVAEHVAEDILSEAMLRVIESQQRREAKAEIVHLPSYVWTTYKHLLFLHTKRAGFERELTEKGLEHLPSPIDSSQRIMDAILFEEIVRHLDERTRFILEKRLLNYTFEEIASEYEAAFGKPIRANRLRNIYYRTVLKLRRELSPL